jgi:hypothetical protein
VDVVTSATGTLSWTFILINSLTDCQIVVFEGDSSSPPAPLASTGPIIFSDVNAPMRVHLGRVEDPTVLRVIWNSNSESDSPTVQWGFTAGGPYPFSSAAESYTYDASDLCTINGAPSVATSHGWFWGGFWHYALISGLTPGSKTVVYYVAGSTAAGWSREHSTVAAPAIGPNSPTNLLLVADMGVTTLDATTDHWAEPDAGETIDHMRDHAQSGSGYDWDLVLHSGDLAYVRHNAPARRQRTRAVL